MNFINEDVICDFPMSKDMKWLIEQCEKFDREDDYGAYENYASSLVDVVCKEACRTGYITREQWRKIEMRYQL